MEPSDAVETAARKMAGKLDRFRPDIMACRVTMELAEKHQHQGRPFAVRVDVTVPDHELSVDRVHDEDVYVALREAFDDMKRQLEDSVRRVRGQEKLHSTPLRGEVVRFGDEGRCGFIRTPSGDEYWFGPDNVAGVPFRACGAGRSGAIHPRSRGRRQAGQARQRRQAPRRLKACRDMTHATRDYVRFILAP